MEIFFQRTFLGIPIEPKRKYAPGDRSDIIYQSKIHPRDEDGKKVRLVIEEAEDTVTAIIRVGYGSKAINPVTRTRQFNNNESLRLSLPYKWTTTQVFVSK